MTLPVISEDDLVALGSVFPDLDFLDAERRAVLLERGSRDVNAAPGSGKTTVLAAKLLLLATKWPFERRGICVLSHTNVARAEVQRRLGVTAQGERLLGYPHFIGTIHAFVNQYLALPFMRSEGIDVEVIDNDVFSSRAVAMARRNGTLRAWMDKRMGVDKMIGGLVFHGPNLAIASEEGRLPQETAKSYPLLRRIKVDLARDGVFRHADMFAFAECLLEKSPFLKDRMSLRFPLVFIDEMQDTSRAQEDLLSRLFDQEVIIQRLGDTNQRILGSDTSADLLTFPRTSALSIGTSKRFGPRIASVVSGVRVGGAAVVGQGDDLHRPLLLTYDSACVGEVLSAFGHEVLARFDDERIGRGPVKALCARRRSDAKKESPGRSLVDYWPDYAEESRAWISPSERFWSLLRHSKSTPVGSSAMLDRANSAQQAVLLVLRAAGSEDVVDVREGSRLIPRLRHLGRDTLPVQLLCRTLTLDGDLGLSEASRLDIPGVFFDALKPLLPEGLTLQRFVELPVFREPESLAEVEVTNRVCRVLSGGRAVDIHIGTIASMKGETHLATLVLEAFGHPARRFDLCDALPVIAGIAPRNPKMKESQSALFRNLYVGLSRPAHFLSVAVNVDRVSKDCQRALVAQGWETRHIATREAAVGDA